MKAIYLFLAGISFTAVSFISATKKDLSDAIEKHTTQINSLTTSYRQRNEEILSHLDQVVKGCMKRITTPPHDPISSDKMEAEAQRLIKALDYVISLIQHSQKRLLDNCNDSQDNMNDLDREHQKTLTKLIVASPPVA